MATPMGPSTAEVVVLATTGFKGMRQALFPQKFWAIGTCKLVAVMPLIMLCEGKALEAMKAKLASQLMAGVPVVDPVTEFRT